MFLFEGMLCLASNAKGGYVPGSCFGPQGPLCTVIGCMGVVLAGIAAVVGVGPCQSPTVCEMSLCVYFCVVCLLCTSVLC